MKIVHICWNKKKGVKKCKHTEFTPFRTENNFSILANILVLKSWKMRFFTIFADVTLISHFKIFLFYPDERAQKDLQKRFQLQNDVSQSDFYTHNDCPTDVTLLWLICSFFNSFKFPYSDSPKKSTQNTTFIIDHFWPWSWAYYFFYFYPLPPNFSCSPRWLKQIFFIPTQLRTIDLQSREHFKFSCTEGILSRWSASET